LKNERTCRKHYASGQSRLADGIKHRYVYIIIVIIVKIMSVLSARQVTDLSQMSTSYVEVVDVADECVVKLHAKSATSLAVSCRVVTCRAAIM